MAKNHAALIVARCEYSRRAASALLATSGAALVYPPVLVRFGWRSVIAAALSMRRNGGYGLGLVILGLR